MTNFNFSPKKISHEVENKIAIQRLPSWAQESEQIQKYFDDAIQQWFTPEQQRTLDGYVGMHGGPNSAGKTYINEISPARTEYQLAPAMVSTDATNAVNTMLTYPDLVDNLAFNGCLTDNVSRLLSGRFYCWAPAINPDMIVNYSNYYWDATNADGVMEPDYVVMERGSRDGNMWSALNHWYPVTYTDESGTQVTITDDDIKSGKYVQARRSIVEFIKNMELYNFGRTTRGFVDLLAEQTTPEEIMFRDASNNIRVDGQLIRPNDRILFTSISNPGENNRVYKVVIERKDDRDVYGLILDPAEIAEDRETGEPKYNDTLRVKRGTSWTNAVVYWNNTEWIRGQQKHSANQFPLFNLYDKNENRLDSEIYPGSSFKGSKVFSVLIDSTYPKDSVYGQNIRKDKYGSFVYMNDIQNDSFTYVQRGQTLDITGMKFYRVTADVETDDVMYADWRESSIQTRQYVSQTIEPTKYVSNATTGETAFNTKYKLAVSVGTNPVGVSYPLIRVDMNGEALDTTKYEISNGEIEIKSELNDESVIKVLTYNGQETPDLNLGAYEVPSNLKNNANNQVITEIEESRLADHFYDIIQSQDDFTGSAVGINNYYNSKRDMSLGRKIVQHDASLLPLMVHNSDDRLDLVKATDYTKTAYNNFKNKFTTRLTEINSDGYGTQTAAQVVSSILAKINVGKSDEFAFWLSGMAASDAVSQTFIPPTPQYLGILPVYQPRVRVRKVLNGVPSLFNVSHTGSLSRAFSTITVRNGTEAIIRDFRDDVMFELEMMMFRSFHVKLVSEDYIPALSVYDVRPGVFRTTDYNASDYEKIALRSFEQWAISNAVDYHTNTSYNADNWRTWNYSTCTYTNSQPARGNWKAIYIDYFDTTEPNTKPWEMLGFSMKPSWWDEEYVSNSIRLSDGTVAYLGDELLSDLESGTIRRGNRSGVDSRFARSGLSTVWPVNQVTGELVPVYEVASTGQVPMVSHKPSYVEAQADWRFGDIGDIEFSYMNSNHYAFEEALILYRAKPAQWANYFWDTTSFGIYKLGSQTQWLRDVTDQRFSVDRDNTVVHGENLNRVVGYQMWISDFLKHNHIDITRAYGNIMRGAGVKLSYRLGGFSKNENLTFVSDSFGLVSQENQQLSLLKSAVRRQEVLSGIRIRFDGNMYVVSGYDSSTPYFKYLKPVRSGRRYSVRLGNISLVQYKEYHEQVHELKYDTRFRTIQDVFEFIIGYGEYLRQRGWIFEELTDEGEYFDWRHVGAGFANWANGKRTVGDFINLSPATTSVKFASVHGNIDSIAQFSGGSWTLVDDQNTGIGMHEVSVSRIGSIINVRLNDDVDKRIMLMRVNVNEYEHAVVFDNLTIFGDVMYIPEFGLHQPRLRVYGNIADGWNGRLEAPGFMIVGNNTLPNFEKLVNDFKKYYDSENPTSSVDLNNLARHAIGYQSRDYLRRLILNERSQVEFYKGYIKEKGTVQSFDKILRTSKQLRTPNYKVIEEWAFKIGEYGDVANDQRLEFLLQNSELKQEPQSVIFDSARTQDVVYDDVITYFGSQGTDTRWITRSVDNQKFPLTSHDSHAMDIPTVGPVNLKEVDLVVNDLTEIREARNRFIAKHSTQPQRIWIINGQGTWDIVQLHTTDVYARETLPVSSALSILNMDAPHGLVENDIFFFDTPEHIYPELSVDAYYQFSYVLSSTQLHVRVNSEKQFFDSATGLVNDDAPRLYYYRSIFANQAARDTYIADRATDIVDIDSFKRPVIYNRETHRTETYLTLWDPMQGVIPGLADSEVKFKSQQDPAIYNNINKDSASWGPAQVGTVWWDTKKAYYLDYTQPVRNSDNSIDEVATRDYRRENWGKMLPAGEVVLYEWVRSPVHPVDWDDYVGSQDALNKSKTTWIPSGDAVQDSWCEVAEFDQNSNEFKLYYYFWVRNAIHVPNVKSRQRSISELARIITDPSSLNLPWFAPVSDSEYLVSGINSLITDDNSVLQIVYKSKANAGNVHKQWRLFQEGSDYTFDDDVWQTMVDSLCGQSLPDAVNKVHRMKYPESSLGNELGKTWFKDNVEARREFVSAANQYFKSTNIASDLLLMTTVFNYEETTVNPNQRDFIVTRLHNENVLQITSPENFKENDAVIINTNGALPKPLDKSVIYFVERVPGESDKFRIKATPNSITSITLLDKGIGSHNIVRSVDAQSSAYASLDMKNYWSVVDWYDAGYSDETPFTEMSSTAAADQLHFNIGDVIKVTDENGVWVLYARAFSRDIPIWRTVGRKNSTILLNGLLHGEHTQLDENNEFTIEEQVIQKAIRLLSTVFTSAQSRIVFPMIYYIHNEQKVVDWVFKTSYISILGIDKSLSTTDVTHSDPLSDVSEYINEIKPYRSKVRGSVDQRTSDTEIIAANMMDSDTNQDEHDKYVAEWDKPESSRDFSGISSNLRQQGSVVMFDHVSSVAASTLKDQIEYERLISTYFTQDDEALRLPSELLVQGCTNPVFNAVYSELLDSRDYPDFSADFHPQGSETIIIDRVRRVYRHSTTDVDYYIWNLIGSGWIISTPNTATTDWYYEDTTRTDGLSAKHPSEVAVWISADQKVGEQRGNTATVMSVTTAIAERPDPNKSHQLGRIKRDIWHVEDIVIEQLYTGLLSIKPSLSRVEYTNEFEQFMERLTSGELYFDLNKFRDVCIAKWSIPNDADIMNVVAQGFATVDDIVTFLDTANRVRIYNPDSTNEYIESVVDAGFKGCQIHNQPNFNGTFGYAAQSDDSLSGYYLWSYEIYQKLLNNLVNGGMSLFNAQQKLREYGYSEVTKYVPYIGTDIDVNEKSVFIKPATENGLNDTAWEANNPLKNDAGLLHDGFVNDVANFDNLGYDKQTRSIVAREIGVNKHIFDIRELQVEDANFGNLVVTFAKYRPEGIQSVDFGVYIDGGFKPGSQRGVLSADYGDDFNVDIDGLFEWDFGSQYGVSFSSSIGSFSVQGDVIRNPRNPDEVVVSAPRTVKPIALNWNSDNFTYPVAERKIYPFTLSATEGITHIRVGKHSMQDFDTVILLAQDLDIPTPTGARFNEVTTEYQVRVVNDTTVTLMDSEGADVVLDATDLAQYQQLEARVMFSMFHVIKPQALSDVRVDVLNYDKIYGRYLSGGSMFNTMRVASNTSLSVPNHGLKTSDSVIFSTTKKNLDLGDLVLGNEYFVVVTSPDSIQLVPGIDDAILRTNQIDLGPSVSECSMTVVNFWIASTTQSVRRQRSWHDAHDRKVFFPRLDEMKANFAGDELISHYTDEIVDHGFARPTIDEGSLRDLVRARMQEQISITVFQDERGLTAANSNQVHDSKGTLMYNQGGTSQYAFRITKSPADLVWHASRLADEDTAELSADFWYNDDTLIVDGNVQPSGTIELNGEYIKYNNSETVVLGSQTRTKLTGIQRGAQYTSEARKVRSGKVAVQLDGPNQHSSRMIARDSDLSDSIIDQTDYHYASTILFDMDGEPNNADHFTALKDAPSAFSADLKENYASFGRIGL